MQKRNVLSRYKRQHSWPQISPPMFPKDKHWTWNFTSGFRSCCPSCISDQHQHGLSCTAARTPGLGTPSSLDPKSHWRERSLRARAVAPLMASFNSSNSYSRLPSFSFFFSLRLVSMYWEMQATGKIKTAYWCRKRPWSFKIAPHCASWWDQTMQSVLKLENARIPAFPFPTLFC